LTRSTGRMYFYSMTHYPNRAWRYLTLLLFTIYLTTIPARACINEWSVTLKGDIEETLQDFVPTDIVNHAANTELYLAKLLVLDSLWKNNHDINAYSDYGVNLVYLGRYQEALEIFLAIEKISPGRYGTAANLGTTYELLGDNQKALTWIQRAIAIYPRAHEGTEWLHVKILQAKINNQLATGQFLLDVNFGGESIPTTAKTIEELYELRHDLYYQLHERMSFVKPEEPIVALLLFELGNVLSVTNEVSSALLCYDLAKQYGFKSDVLAKRYEAFSNMQVKAEAIVAVQEFMPIIIAVAALIISGFVIWWIVLRRKSSNKTT
jgi:tetratricopeptide (TPR) repeat protein